MKTTLLKSLLLLAGATTAVGAVAETPREVAPLLTEGKSWLMLEGREIPGDIMGAYYTMTVSGDTIVDGRTCKRVVKAYVGREQEDKITYALYEEDGRIYTTGYSKALILDFNGKPGDKLPVNHLWSDDLQEYPLEILQENKVTVNGEERRELVIGFTTPGESRHTIGSWVEGVGMTNLCGSLFKWCPIPVCSVAFIDDAIMIACYEDGKQIFSREDFSYRPELPREPAKMLTDGKSWRVGVHITDEFSEVHERTVEYDIAVCGDTIVDGIACKLLESCPVDEPANKTRLVGYEGNGRVYNVIPRDDAAATGSRATFLPLMDFTFFCHEDIAEYSSADNGAYIGPKEDVVVRNVNIKEIDGGNRREIVIDNTEGTICWIEGVGANFSGNTTWLTAFPLLSNGKSTITYMIECRQDGQVIFTADDFTHKYEHASIRELTAGSTPADGALHDLLGRRVAKPAAGSIYIKDGRKLLAR